MTLTAHAEARLLAEAQAGSTAASASLLDHHEPLLRSIVGRFPWRASAGADDLMQEARLAFLKVIETFDTAQAPRLNTAARHYVAAAVRQAVAASADVSIPKRTLGRYLAAWQGTDSYATALDAATTGPHPMAPATFAAVFHALHGGTSLDAKVPDDFSDGGRSWHDIAPLSDTDDGSADYARSLVKDLPTEEHRAVIALAFGLLGDEPMIDSAIAATLGLSRATVQRRRVEALALMSTAATSGPV